MPDRSFRRGDTDGDALPLEGKILSELMMAIGPGGVDLAAIRKTAHGLVFPDDDPTPDDAIHHAGHVELPGPAHGEPQAVAMVAPADDPRACPCVTWSRSPLNKERAGAGNGHHPACHRYRRTAEARDIDPPTVAARKAFAVLVRDHGRELKEHGEVLERLAAELVAGVEPTSLAEARRVVGYRGEWVADVGRELLGLAAGDEWTK
jgi:hypothetical protein